MPACCRCCACSTSQVRFCTPLLLSLPCAHLLKLLPDPWRPHSAAAAGARLFELQAARCRRCCCTGDWPAGGMPDMHGVHRSTTDRSTTNRSTTAQPLLPPAAGADCFLLESIFRTEVWDHMQLPISEDNERACYQVGCCLGCIRGLKLMGGVAGCVQLPISESNERACYQVWAGQLQKRRVPPLARHWPC